MKNGLRFSAFGFWIFLFKLIKHPKTEDRRPKTEDRFLRKIRLNYFNYFTEIEETFIRRRGRNLLLSPLDWALIEDWQEREIPLHIILRAIESVFDAAEKRPDKKRTIKSLSYCKEEIEAQFAEWSEMQTGKSLQSAEDKVQSSDESFQHSGDEMFSGEAIKNHFEKVIFELEQAKEKTSAELNESFERVLSRLKQLQSDNSKPEKLEESLEKLDALIDEALINSGGEKLVAVKKEIEKNLASYKAKMETEVYQRTFNLMLTKRLREEVGLPRLSLFYL